MDTLNIFNLSFHLLTNKAAKDRKDHIEQHLIEL